MHGRGKRGAQSIYFRVKADGSRSWYFHSARKFSSALPSREAAIEGRAKAQLRSSAGLPQVDPKVRMRDLIEEVRETQRRNVRGSTLACDLRGLDILDREVGHLRPGQLIGSDRLDRLVRELLDGTLTGNPLSPASVRRYLSPLGLVAKLAIRRGLLQVSLIDMIDWPRETDREQKFEWSRESVANLIEASEKLARKSAARYDYSPLFRVLVATGLRIGELLALRVEDIDLLSGKLVVRHTLNRDGSLGSPKTAAGRREVPLGDALVALLAETFSVDAEPTDFVFSSKRHASKPLSYFNVRRRGFEPARDAAGLPASVTLHSLRSAAISLFVESGMTMTAVAGIVGHSDSAVTARVYARPFETDAIGAQVRAAQESLSVADASKERLAAGGFGS